MNVQVTQTRQFKKIKKKLKPNQIRDLDLAIQAIVKDPELGEQKKGDLAGVWVHKFSMTGQLTLLAYEWDEVSRTLLFLGVHENFYRDLKRMRKIF
ncbi:MAG: type II toxin-antitoxin system RelE/ParE family toxin [Candidatus Omnitrophica bacterium]|nr:type II toxin-antitoxin system RelE/ParE family toxin [Candidatus Omnitrophota bacterium]